jgi:multiple sugar transport system substrate-binding protein
MVDLHLLNEVMEDTVNHSQFKKYQSTLKIIDTSLQQLIESNEDMDVSLLTLQREVNQYLKE